MFKFNILKSNNFILQFSDITFYNQEKYPCVQKHMQDSKGKILPIFEKRSLNNISLNDKKGEAVVNHHIQINASKSLRNVHTADKSYLKFGQPSMIVHEIPSSVSIYNRNLNITQTDVLNLQKHETKTVQSSDNPVNSEQMFRQNDAQNATNLFSSGSSAGMAQRKRIFGTFDTLNYDSFPCVRFTAKQQYYEPDSMATLSSTMTKESHIYSTSKRNIIPSIVIPNKQEAVLSTSENKPRKERGQILFYSRQSFPNEMPPSSDTLCPPNLISEPIFSNTKCDNKALKVQENIRMINTSCNNNTENLQSINLKNSKYPVRRRINLIQKRKVEKPYTRKVVKSTYQLINKETQGDQVPLNKQTVMAGLSQYDGNNKKLEKTISLKYENNGNKLLIFNSHDKRLECPKLLSSENKTIALNEPILHKNNTNYKITNTNLVCSPYVKAKHSKPNSINTHEGINNHGESHYIQENTEEFLKTTIVLDTFSDKFAAVVNKATVGNSLLFKKEALNALPGGGNSNREQLFKNNTPTSKLPPTEIYSDDYAHFPHSPKNGGCAVVAENNVSAICYPKKTVINELDNSVFKIPLSPTDFRKQTNEVTGVKNFNAIPSPSPLAFLQKMVIKFSDGTSPIKEHIPCQYPSCEILQYPINKENCNFPEKYEVQNCPKDQVSLKTIKYLRVKSESEFLMSSDFSDLLSPSNFIW